MVALQLMLARMLTHLLDTMLIRRDMPVESDTGDTCHMPTNKLDSQFDDKTDDNTCCCAGDTTSA